MRSYRIFLSHVLMSIAATLFAGTAFADAGTLVRHHFVETASTSYAAASADFAAQLAVNAQLRPEAICALPSDLRRDSHGYRQASAEPVTVSEQPKT